MTAITLNSINKRFGPVHVLKDISLEFDKGEFVVLVGPSGCGKSTLLRMIAGLEPVSSGDMIFGDTRVNDLEPRERDIAMVFQSYALYPHMNVERNLGFSLELRKRAAAEKKERTSHAAGILGLDKLLDRFPKALSGGQRQRVAMGRAIVRDPQIFLFDEPLSNLDAALRIEMRIEIAKLHQRLGTTMVYVTHDQVEAMTLADRIVVMNAGQVEQVGTPLDLYSNPANLFVAGFLGSPKMNFVAHDDAALNLPSSLTNPAAQTYGIRPEHIKVTAPDDTAHLLGTIDVVERLGSDTIFYINHGATKPFVVRVPGIDRTAIGEKIGCQFQPEDLHLFDQNGQAISEHKNG